MLSYRHSFHAGNHGDVLKHWLLVATLHYLNQKDKPYWYIDTHAGVGKYYVNSKDGQKIREHESGIQRLLELDDKNISHWPESLCLYREQVSRLNDQNKLTVYPGSPFIAKNITRSIDKLRLFELHPVDAKKLTGHFKGDRRTKVSMTDGLKGLKALLPPEDRRGAIMIDPSYEVKAEYHWVMNSLKDGLKRFQTGVFMLWYPMLNTVDNIQFQEKLEKFDQGKWINLKLIVDSRTQAKGMYGSGMFVLNPPWPVVSEAETVLQILKDSLGVEGFGDAIISSSGNL
ncbi:MAG: 23S rRNA (adenine(2030)-N(6))-methyltransferase RlmJ [Pseudomonadales bacterium]|nr:23S rRNA (adenine(2030)-N(6))-methyltransferase RlmJ [Pseudomonadales bacterium]